MAPTTRSQIASALEMFTRTLRSSSWKSKETEKFPTRMNSSTSSRTRSLLLPRSKRTKQSEKQPVKQTHARKVSKKLTSKRSKMVQSFLKMFHSNQQDYAVYGSEDWVHILIKYMKVAPPFEILPSTVRNWMKAESVFEKANGIHGYIPTINAAGAREDVNEEDHLTTESDNDIIFSVVTE